MGIRKEGVGKFLLSFGLLIMLHAAYSTAEWRAYDRKTTPIDETDAMMTSKPGPAEAAASRGILGGLPADIALDVPHHQGPGPPLGHVPLQRPASGLE